ncbi:MAG TPA: hypothetical protein IAC37_02950 [Candidatus Ventrimonas merdavium]|nr:hypothetical protein [Candidatus Ventrimonas merdavium]
MSSKTKIVVLRMKEIIYTAIFVGFGILLVMLLFVMFRPEKEAAQSASADPLYIPGVYAASLTLGSQEVDVEVTVDPNQITSITMVPLSDAVATMYPLMEPSLTSLTEQICRTQSLDSLTYPEESRYTSQVLIGAIETALEKARVK